MTRDWKILAIVVKKEIVGEHNEVVTLLSPDNGILRVKSYGSTRGAGKCYSPLYGEGVFSIERKNSSTFYLKDSEIISEHEWVKDSIEKISWTSLFSELVLSSRLGGGALYRLFTSALDNIDGDNIYKVSAYFITHFLLIEGLSGDWETCPVCSKIYGQDEVLGFSSLTNSAVCSSCDTFSSTLILPPNARRYLFVISHSNIEDALCHNISIDALKRIDRYLVRSLEFVFPVTLKAVQSGLIS